MTIRQGLRHDRCVGCNQPHPQPTRAEPFERELFCSACLADPFICQQNEPPPPTPAGGWLHPARYQSHEAVAERAAAGNVQALRQLQLLDL